MARPGGERDGHAAYPICEIDNGSVLALPGGKLLRLLHPMVAVLAWLTGRGDAEKSGPGHEGPEFPKRAEVEAHAWDSSILSASLPGLGRWNLAEPLVVSPGPYLFQRRVGAWLRARAPRSREERAIKLPVARHLARQLRILGPTRHSWFCVDFAPSLGACGTRRPADAEA